MPLIKISKSSIDKIPFEDEKQVFYRDTQLKGFGIYAGQTSKTFFVEKWVNNKAVRTTIGKYGQVTAEQARKMALKLLGEMSQGINPNIEKKALRADQITLNEVFEDFLQSRKNLKPRTVSDYKNAIEKNFKDWKRKPITEITKSMVAKRHTKLGETIGAAQSNQSMRVLRALFNFAQGWYEDARGKPLIGINPVRVLSETKGWYRVDRRRTYIKPPDLSAWFDAVMELENETIRDFLLFCLFTGFRREEGSSLNFEQIDFRHKTIHLPDPKNREPFFLPMSDFILELLRKRMELTGGGFVFPSKGKKGYLQEPRKAIRKVTQLSGIGFTCHDLRRTYCTIAESLDIPHYAMKRLLNHRLGGDVTEAYIGSDVERLRRPMQQITDHLMYLVGSKPGGKVINFNVKMKSG